MEAIIHSPYIQISEMSSMKYGEAEISKGVERVSATYIYIFKCRNALIFIITLVHWRYLKISTAKVQVEIAGKENV